MNIMPHSTCAQSYGSYTYYIHRLHHICVGTQPTIDMGISYVSSTYRTVVSEIDLITARQLVVRLGPNDDIPDRTGSNRTGPARSGPFRP